MNLTAHQSGNYMNVKVPVPTSLYLDRVMRKRCFPELHELFMHAHRPAKELTESYAALCKLRPYMRKDKQYTVYHIGDGAHCRTAAMFAFLTKNTYNISVDPIANQAGKARRWMEKHNAERMAYSRCRVENHKLLPHATHPNIIFTFVHAHVDVTRVLTDHGLWMYAYTSACCYPKTQLIADDAGFKILKAGHDYHILSPERQYQVVSNTL